MKKLFVFIISFIALLFCLYASALGSPNIELGRKFLDISEGNLRIAKFDEALKYVNFAIAELSKAAFDSAEGAEAAARAYYVKSYILSAIESDELTIREVLLDALIVAPKYEPPEPYMSHPRTAKIIDELRIELKEESDFAFKRASIFYERGQFCEAAEILEPVVDKCSSQRIAQMILDDSKGKCNRDPGPPPEASIRIGIFPVGFENKVENESQELQEIPWGSVTKDSIYNALKDIGVDVVIIPVDDTKSSQILMKNNLQHFGQFVVRASEVDTAPIADLSTLIKLIVQGRENLELFGWLHEKKRPVVKSFGKKEGFEYLLFTRMRLWHDKDTDRILLDLDMNLYQCDEPGMAVVRGKWTEIPSPYFIKEKNKEIASIIKEYFSNARKQ